MDIFAIDPANELSGYVRLHGGKESYEIAGFGKTGNDAVMLQLKGLDKGTVVVIERIASYGMAVGRSIFETCEWVGRFTEAATERGLDVQYVLRQEEKLALCHDTRAKDANIRKALIDRYARHDFDNGKGKKDHPDTFYGFRADCWAACAVAVAYLDRTLGETQYTITKNNKFHIDRNINPSYNSAKAK